jgi:hypothetical protein
MLIEKNLAFRTLCFLANLCNSTIIEIYGDIVRVPHGFEYCQMQEYIAGNTGSYSGVLFGLFYREQILIVALPESICVQQNPAPCPCATQIRIFRRGYKDHDD